ncbi:uncharacterized protein THITE_2120000 [Thermothielavioides terrestris NRRL 8126]|uniref:DUF1740-domain-containing protein n=1 Tax=Thermothielavioides terrestris (strain ATCC 38088 / NRRL 8126) TaxID=578455 RepID=G2R9B5_THETT|nr:uncharacterized protein THITE_2120000 [Thermothielavioides terrestris NRRL 8126]AEO69513.1 hypothetical protein THITE_2120000 [Thermothielavioides terrestris NRRL 8126]
MEREKARRAVPKFASFKPQPSPESNWGPDTRPAPEAPARSQSVHGGSESRPRDDRRDERHRHRHRDRDREQEREEERERGRRHFDRERQRTRDRDRERESEGVGEGRRERAKERDYGRERGRDDHRDHLGPQPTSPKSASGERNHDRKDAAVSSHLFVLDTRGDPLILQYGANDRSAVPAYYRFGAGRVMGSPGFLTMHRDGAQEQFSIRAPGEGSGSGSVFRDKALMAALHRAEAQRILPSPDQSLPPASDDFIPLGPSRKRKRDQDNYPSLSPTPDYRSIYGKARPSTAISSSRSPSSSPSRSPSPPPPQPPQPPTATLTEATALTRHLQTHPADLPAWHRLIALQDALFREQQQQQQQHGGSSSTTTNNNSTQTREEKQALAELKVGLYRQALRAHASAPPSSSQYRSGREREWQREREALQLGLLREGRRAGWEERVLCAEWDKVASRRGAGGEEGGGGGGFGLWRGRLDFEMGRVAAFTLEEIRALVEGRLRELGRRLGRRDRVAGAEGVDEDDDEEQLCEEAVYVFLRLTRLLQDAGFAELAVAAWQGVLELTFCRPPGESMGAEAALDSFAEFWESEVPRMGEAGARGWGKFVEEGEALGGPPEAKRERPLELPRTGDPFEAWAAVEQQAAARTRLPARTLDEGTEDDPFRVVLFSDIKELLIWFPSAVLPRVRPLLADAFLVFCGLPPAGLSGDKFAALLGDPFVAGRGQGIHPRRDDHDVGAAPELSKKYPEFAQQGGSMAVSPDVLFSGDLWFRYLDRWSDFHAGDKKVDYCWVLGMLRHLVKESGMEQLAEYYLAMEWRNEPAGARKVAKGLLKQYSSSIRLYISYALIERANGNVNVAYKVLSSATGLASSSPSSISQLLWNTWAWVHLEAGQKESALARLCSSADSGFEGSTVSPALLLKARSYFSSTRDYSLSSKQLDVAAQHAESLMLLEYLSAEGGSEPAAETQGNISTALDSIHAFSRELESRALSESREHERLLQSAARLLYHHATHGPYRPIYIRTQLHLFIRLFPSNTLLLSLFAWSHQPALRIDDPVRDALRTLSLTPPHDSLGTRRFAIQHEARVGTAHSVRAAFEAALDSDACRGSAELWARYVRFCAGSRELRGRVREVFYRAIAACPGVKEVYMEGFGLGVLSASELRAVGETMAAKGLRMHVDLEEFLGKWEKEHGERG